jgi:hypothetical protein
LRSDADIEVAAQQFLYLCLSGLLHRRLWMVTDRPSQEDAAANVASAIAAFMGAYGAA